MKHFRIFGRLQNEVKLGNSISTIAKWMKKCMIDIILVKNVAQWNFP
jgi:hypothetical protein